MEKFQRITTQPISKHLRGGKQCENRTEMENGEAQLELKEGGNLSQIERGQTTTLHGKVEGAREGKR